MLTDERAKQLMQQVGMPNSLSLLQALMQCDMEATLAERERCAKLCDEIEAKAMADDKFSRSDISFGKAAAAEACAEAIRAS